MNATTESDLWQNVRDAEDALKGEKIARANQRMRDIDGELTGLESKLQILRKERAELSMLVADAEDTLEIAREAVRRHFAASRTLLKAEIGLDDDVHAAVKAMAEEVGYQPPEAEAKVMEDEALMGEDVTHDNVAHTIPSEAPSDWVLATRDKLSLCAGDEAMAFEPFDTVSDDLPAFTDLSPAEQAEVVAVLDDDEPFVALANEAPQDCLVIGRASDVTDEMLAEARVADERDSKVAGRNFNPWV